MDYGIYVAASGFLSQEKRLEIIANNLANANTAGYKGDMPVFRISNPSLPESQVGQGAALSAAVLSVLPQVRTDFSQGPLTQTGNPLDVAIVGEGFFEIETPRGPRYTRKGDFTLSTDGTLVTQGGHPVKGEGGAIALTEGEVTIDQTGTVFVDGKEEGQLRVVTFPATENLVKEGEGLFAWDGEGSQARPSDEVDVRQGYLENSNVDAIREMVQMIEALRVFEDHQKMIQAFDSAHKSAVNEIGRLR